MGDGNLEIIWLTNETYGSWVLGGILNILSRSWETGPTTLGVSPSMNIGAFLDMKSPTWQFEDDHVSKYKIMGSRIEDGFGVVSIGILELEPNDSTQSTVILLVSLCSAI
ncbi:unnamed protein product [Lactuca saligna]|uniref:Uncharacterized protein n=1 Tax=Lactuca saligna TaxID=75948 RepID=A0AA36A3C6_LACSI|nr:unnamed protein product [Lactuca saligna]